MRAALFGELPDITIVEFIDPVCAFPPALGLLTVFLPGSHLPALPLHVEQDAKAGGDRCVSLPMAPVLQHDLSGADLLSPEGERDLAAGADGAWRVVRFGGQRLDELFIEAINRPAVTRGRILRQAYPDRFALADL